MAILQVQSIACVNEGAFVMDFWISWIDINTGTSGFTNNNSGNYPVGQTRVFDLTQADPPIPLDAIVWPTVRVVFGGQVDGNAKLQFARNNETATYAAQGTIFSFSVNKQ
jgi:hypothetical protein